MLLPAVTVCVAGVTVMVKFCSTSATFADFEIVPMIPVTFRVEFPPGADGAAVTVMVEVPAPVMLAGLNVAVTPVGNPITEGMTVPLKPFTAVVVTV